MLIDEFLSDNNIQGPRRYPTVVTEACAMIGTAMEEESVQTDLAQYLEVGVRRDSGEYYIKWTYALWVEIFICYPGTQEPQDAWLSAEIYKQFLNGCYHNHYKRSAA